MNKLKYIGILLPLLFSLVACEDDDNGDGAHLAISHTSRLMTEEGGEFTIAVSSTVSGYKVESESTWFSLVEKSNDYYTFSVAENDSYTARSGAIYVTAGNLRDSVIVYQYSKEGLFLTTREYTVGPDSTGVSLNLSYILDARTDKTPFIMKPLVDWIAFVPATRAVADSIFTFSVEANDLNEDRAGQVAIKWGDFSDTLTIVQTEKLGVYFNANAQTLDSDGGNAIGVPFKRNIGEITTSIIADSNWLRVVTPSVTSRSLEPDTLYLEVDENKLLLERSAKLVINSGLLTDTIDLTQEAATIETVSANNYKVYSACTAAKFKNKLDQVDPGAVFTLESGCNIDISSGNYVFTKAVTIKGESATELATLKVKGFTLKPTEVVSEICLENLNIAGIEAVGGTSNYVFDYNGGSANVKILTLKNCNISDFGCSLLRADRVTTAGVLNLNVDNCILTRVAGKQGIVSTKVATNVSFTNSTFNNSWTYSNVRFVRYQTTTENVTCKILNNTFYNVSTTGSSSIMIDGVATTAGEIKNNIIYLAAGIATIKEYGTNGTYDVGNNCVPVAFTDGFDATTDITTDPEFADAANGDFTVGNATVKADKYGDPRWLK